MTNQVEKREIGEESGTRRGKQGWEGRKSKNIEGGREWEKRRREREGKRKKERREVKGHEGQDGFSRFIFFGHFL